MENLFFVVNDTKEDPKSRKKMPIFFLSENAPYI